MFFFALSFSFFFFSCGDTIKPGIVPFPYLNNYLLRGSFLFSSASLFRRLLTGSNPVSVWLREAHRVEVLDQTGGCTRKYPNLLKTNTFFGIINQLLQLFSRLNSQWIFQSIIQFHDCGLITTTVTIIRRREYCYDVTIVTPVNYDEFLFFPSNERLCASKFSIEL